MNQLDKQSFAELMIASGEMYNKSISKELMAMYFDCLVNYSIKEIKDGLNKHVLDSNHGTFFPKPADIVRSMDGGEQTIEDKANIAWMEIEDAIKRVGAYGKLEMDDKLALMTVKNMGNWQSICHTPMDKMVWKKKEFIENYKALEHTPLDTLPKSLPGITDLTNQRRGDTQAIGDVMKRMKLENKKVN